MKTFVRPRTMILVATVGGLGLVATLFSTVYSAHNATATTPQGPWKQIGTVATVKKSVSGAEWVLTLTAPPAKAALLAKGSFVIVINAAPPANGYPASGWQVVALKGTELRLTKTIPGECAPAAAPTGGSMELYLGPCTKPTAGTGNAGNLSGVFDIIIDGGNPATDLGHCIARTAVDDSGAVKAAADCFDNTGVFVSAGAAAEPLNDVPGEGTTGDAGGVGPPPPPPYSSAPPAIGGGTYSTGTDTLVTITCFADVGRSVNNISRVTIGPGTDPANPAFGANAQLGAFGRMRANMDLYTGQSNAACDALTPVGAPGLAALSTSIYPATDIAACPAANCVQAPYRLNGNVLHGYPDWDGDGCADADELFQNKPSTTSKCGDEPWNPLDYVSGGDVSGTYNIEAVWVRQDCNPALVGSPTVCDAGGPGVGDHIPGYYMYCDADINQSGKNLTARLLCYVDYPLHTVNPQAVAAPNVNALTCAPAPATYCGDGVSGAPPPGTTVGTYPTNPRLLADVDDKQTVLSGTIDNAQNVIKLAGCLEDRDGHFVWGNMYWEIVVNAHTGYGQVNLRTTVSPSLNCTQPGGPGGPSSGVIPIHMVRQAIKVADPFPGPGASTGRDTDSDGCSDKRELTDTATRGGLRDPFNHYDYFNPSLDGLNRVDDILLVVNEYFIDDPFGMPDMKSLTDRTAIPGGNPWNLGPPDGKQRVDDILNAVKQYFHDC